MVKIKTTHRWLKSWNVKLDAEAKERSLAKELVGPNIEAEAAPFTHSIDGESGEEIRKAPMAYIPNLVAKVVQILDQNDKYRS